MCLSTRGETLFQLLQTIDKQFKLAVIFKTGYNSIIIFTTKNEFYFETSFFKEDFSESTNLPGVYKLESSNGEIKWPNKENSSFGAEKCPF